MGGLGMIIWPNVDQQTEQWFRIRAGRPTASKFDRIITPNGKRSSQWEDFADDLIGECIRPDMIAFTGNKHTDRGNELEPAARDVFAAMFPSLEVRNVGFVTRDDGIIGCSPDALIYQNGVLIAGLEIKCPMAGKHISQTVANVLPSDHWPQVHGGMAVTRLNHWYFMSYCEGMLPFIIRADRDKFTDRLSDELDDFLIYYSERRKRVLPLVTGKEAA